MLYMATNISNQSLKYIPFILISCLWHQQGWIIYCRIPQFLFIQFLKKVEKEENKIKQTSDMSHFTCGDKKSHPPIGNDDICIHLEAWVWMTYWEMYHVLKKSAHGDNAMNLSVKLRQNCRWITARICFTYVDIPSNNKDNNNKPRWKVSYGPSYLN